MPLPVSFANLGSVSVILGLRVLSPTRSAQRGLLSAIERKACVPCNDSHCCHLACDLSVES